jgi:hypothetical protein
VSAEADVTRTARLINQDGTPLTENSHADSSLLIKQQCQQFSYFIFTQNAVKSRLETRAYRYPAAVKL